MSPPSVTVLDYGIGNLLNVVRALEHHGARVTVATAATEVQTLPDRLVLPGVGAFGDAAAELSQRGFGDLIHRFVATQRPFLGICVGAQLLFDTGEEHGEHAGLGLIPGRVQAVPATAPTTTWTPFRSRPSPRSTSQATMPTRAWATRCSSTATTRPWPNPCGRCTSA